MIFTLCGSFNDKKEQHETAKRLLSYALYRETGMVYEQQKIKKNDWGKPYVSAFPQVFYSVTHCSGAVAVGIAPCRIGVDAENIRGFSEAVAKRVCSDKEFRYIANSTDRNRAFFRLWTLKESYIKALGVGFSFPMREANFEIDEKLNVKTSLCGCRFRLIENKHGLIIAACIMSDDDSVGSFMLCDTAHTEI
ncbi:MAG: 4'-phosphopantetheinyl transferase superfamily protein [Clostridia bacterium]|nr:4'-phosphopantetheinyl transferase superfamily protein [Clostridia bacterium]